MTAFNAIAESAIAEASTTELEAAEEEILLERRPVMISNQNFYRADRTNRFDLASITVILERKGLSVSGVNRDGTPRNDPGMVKILREIIPLFRGTPGTQVLIFAGTQPKTSEDSIVWQGPFIYTIGRSVSVQPLLEGVFMAIRFQSEGQPPWNLLGLDLDVDVAGEAYDG